MADSSAFEVKDIPALWEGQGRAGRLGMILILFAILGACLFGVLLAMSISDGSSTDRTTALIVLALTFLVLCAVGGWLCSLAGRKQRLAKRGGAKN